MVLLDNENLLENPDMLKKELELVKKELKIHIVKEKLKLLASRMREAEEKGKTDGLRNIQKEFDKLAKTLSEYTEENGTNLILNENDT